jgi:hypothetical protein
MTVLTHEEIVGAAADAEPDLPRIGWENFFRDGTVTASSEDADHPKALAYDGFTYDGWQPTAGGDQSIAVEVEPAYVSLPGTNGNCPSTPHDAAHNVTGDRTYKARVALDSLAPAAFQGFLCKLQSLTNGNARLGLRPSGKLRFEWSEGGVAKTAESTVTVSSVGITVLQEVIYVAQHDVDNGAVGNDVDFSYSTDGGQSYSPLGSTVTGSGVAAPDSPSVVLAAFAGSSALSEVPDGKGYAAWVYSGLHDGITGGTLVASFDPADDADIGDLSFVSSATGETWTINQSGAEPAELVFPGTANYMAVAAHTLEGCTLTPQASRDGTTWADLDTAYVAVDNRPIVWEFAKIGRTRWRLKINAPAVFRLGAIHVGAKLQLPAALPVGWQPPTLNEKIEYSNVMSQGGQLLGRHVVRRGIETRVTSDPMTYLFARDEWLAFLEAAERFAVFFWWSMGNQAEIVYGGIKDPSAQFTGRDVSARFEIEGLNR